MLKTLTKLSLNVVVAGQRNATSTCLSETTFIDQVANTLEVRVAPGNVRFANAKHVQGSL